MEDLRIDELAEYCHISETHLRRIFTTYMKMSSLEYINTIRIQAACDYLKKTDQPIALVLPPIPHLTGIFVRLRE